MRSEKARQRIGLGIESIDVAIIGDHCREIRVDCSVVARHWRKGIVERIFSKDESIDANSGAVIRSTPNSIVGDVSVH